MDLDTKRNQNREGLRALQKDLSLSGESRLPHCSPGGLFSFLFKAFALSLIETRQEATGCDTARGDRRENFAGLTQTVVQYFSCSP